MQRGSAIPCPAPVSDQSTLVGLTQILDEGRQIVERRRETSLMIGARDTVRDILRGNHDGGVQGLPPSTHNTCPSVLRGARSVRLGELAIPDGHECLHRRRECRGINGLGQILIKARRDGALAILRMGVG